MKYTQVNFNEISGKVKPMHAVNNGPVYHHMPDQRITNFEDYKAAGIPYARNHDASFFATYGGSHTVDVNAIFPNFDADPYDEKSYDFACTDQYLKTIAAAGTECFYRLGSKIEHEIKKYDTLPPKDFKKWAVICEHIIKHYNNNWANGYQMGIKYWEIWNEADLDPDDSENKRTWGGTAAEYYELYNITANHLKSKFPDLKIGGPACAQINKKEWVNGFFQALDAPLDFFSWHIYTYSPHRVLEFVNDARNFLDDHGYYNTESILNEWNYADGWDNEEFLNTIRTISSLKGASFTAAVMSACQNAPVDMLMYYDARPSAFNGLWKPYTYERLKGYYPFVMFHSLYQLGNHIKASTDDENIYLCAAKNKASNEGALMITYFNNEQALEEEEIKIDFKGFGNNQKIKVDYYLLDADHDNDLVRSEIFTSCEFSSFLKMDLYTTYLMKLTIL